MSMLVQKVKARLSAYEYARPGMPLLFTVFISENNVPCDMQMILIRGDNACTQRPCKQQKFCVTECLIFVIVRKITVADEDYDPSSSS